MSQQIMTITSLVTIPAREWYENDTISVTKSGVINNIEEKGTGVFSDITIIVTPAGVTDTTTEIT